MHIKYVLLLFLRLKNFNFGLFKPHCYEKDAVIFVCVAYSFIIQ
jgi:hypothetical protein